MEISNRCICIPPLWYVLCCSCCGTGLIHRLGKHVFSPDAPFLFAPWLCLPVWSKLVKLLQSCCSLLMSEIHRSAYARLHAHAPLAVGAVLQLLCHRAELARLTCIPLATPSWCGPAMV